MYCERLKLGTEAVQVLAGTTFLLSVNESLPILKLLINLPAAAVEFRLTAIHQAIEQFPAPEADHR